MGHVLMFASVGVSFQRSKPICVLFRNYFLCKNLTVQKDRVVAMMLRMKLLAVAMDMYVRILMCAFENES